MTGRPSAGRRWRFAALASGVLAASSIAALCLSSGCSSVGYLAQSAQGHLGLLASARPVSDWLHDEQLPPALRQRLLLSQRMRDFAVDELKLPDNRSYRSYADLKRPAAVWNVVAAPELSLQLKTWCFPIVGCVAYRGYNVLARAETAAQRLRDQGLEVRVYPVPAYSTLGYSNWLGGDPLLSSFIQWPEGELARLIFHELAHQEVYAAGDTEFNESFATTVERLGAERWLREQGSPAALAQYREIDARRRDVQALTQRYRAALDALYRSERSDADKREGKVRLMAALRSDYAQLKRQRWAGYDGYDAFFEGANNASLGMLAAYSRWVPAFEALFRQQGGDFARFYAAVRHLAALPRDERDATLRKLLPAPAAAD